MNFPFKRICANVTSKFAWQSPNMDCFL